MIQLENGSRISEAIRCWKEFLKSKGKEKKFKILLSKQKKERYRLMIVPSCVEFPKIEDEMLEKISNLKIGAVKKTLKRSLGVNTHSLRYAFITKMLREGVNPSILAKITGHKNLNLIINYTQEIEAIETLEKFVE